MLASFTQHERCCVIVCVYVHSMYTAVPHKMFALTRGNGLVEGGSV